MKTKTNKIKTFFIGLAACFISLSVIMSASHLKDLVKESSHDKNVIGRTVDPVAKALGDLHNHTDKQTLKAISMDNPITVRQREISALNEEKETRNIFELLEEMVIFYRLAFALRLSVAIA